MTDVGNIRWNIFGVDNERVQAVCRGELLCCRGRRCGILTLLLGLQLRGGAEVYCNAKVPRLVVRRGAGGPAMCPPVAALLAVVARCGARTHPC